MNNRYRIYRNYPFLFLFLTFPSLQSFGICFDPTNLNSNLNIRYYAERIFFFLFFYSFSPFTFGKSNFHFLLSRVGDRGVPKPCWNPAAGERITDTFRPEKKGKKDTPGLWRQKSKKKKRWLDTNASIHTRREWGRCIAIEESFGTAWWLLFIYSESRIYARHWERKRTGEYQNKNRYDL